MKFYIRIRKKNISDYGQNLFLFAVFSFVFFQAFMWAPHLIWIDKIFQTNTYSFFTNFQVDSDSFVIARVVQNQQNGIFSANFFSGIDGSYTGSSGIPIWLLSILGTQFGLNSMHIAAALANSLFASLSVVFATRIHSLAAGCLVFVSLLQPWPTSMSHSIYWNFSLKLLPAAIILFLFSRNKNDNKTILAVSFIFNAFTFLAGFEFLTLVVFLQLSVVAYFAIKESYKLGKFVQKIVITILGAASGFFLAVLILITQLRAKFGNFSDAFSNFFFTVNKRTGLSSSEIPEVYRESIAAKPLEVLTPYLKMPIFGSPDSISLISSVSVLQLISIVFVISIFNFGYFSQTKSQEFIGLAALSGAWLVSLLGPIGWYLLARPHSFIHNHINPVLWYVPTIPLGLIIIWIWYWKIHRIMAKNSLLISILIGVQVLIALFFLFSLLTVSQ